MNVNNITDIPQSGVFFQQGAIVHLVIQLVDLNTGAPLNVSQATSMSIFLLYPDQVISRSFSASLWTDGSDGMIAYTTQNDMAMNVDLSEVGLYQMQGQVVLSGITQPASQDTDFYVLQNTFGRGGGEGPVMTADAIILYDTNSVRYAVTVVNGILVVNVQSSGPPNALILHEFVLKDSDGVYWDITVSTVGVLVTTPGGDFLHAIDKVTLMDANGITWVITISTSGVLVAS